MLAANLVQLISACVGILGSIFFAVGVLRQSVEAMARISATYLGWNPNMISALAAQKADYLFGGGLIVAAFALQLVSFLVPEIQVIDDRESPFAPWIAGVFTLLAFFALRAAATRLSKRYEAEISSFLNDYYEKNKKLP